MPPNLYHIAVPSVLIADVVDAPVRAYGPTVVCIFTASGWLEDALRFRPLGICALNDLTKIAPIAPTPNLRFLSERGAMGALTRAYDWSSSPLGPPQTWPQSLRTRVKLVLQSRHPMFIWWGPDLIQFYNDAYAATLGPERHPSALGDRGKDCWAEIWHIIGPQIDYVRVEIAYHRTGVVCQLVAPLPTFAQATFGLR